MRVGATSADLGFTVFAADPAESVTATISDGSDVFAVSTDSCGGASLAEGDLCEVSVRFTPNGEGTFRGALRVGDAEASLTGTGVMASSLTIDPSSANFPDTVVGQMSPATDLVLMNDGLVEVSELAPDAGPDFTVAVGCPTLPPDASCPLTVIFSPSSEGGKLAQLTVGGDAGGTPVTAIASVGGTAIGPATYNLTVSIPNGPGTVTVDPIDFVCAGQQSCNIAVAAEYGRHANDHKRAVSRLGRQL